MNSGVTGPSPDDWHRRQSALESEIEELRHANGLLQRDAAARRHAEDALRQAGALLGKSQAIAHVGSWVLDLPTHRLVWSDEVFRIFGLEPQEFAATYEAFLEAVHPDDRAAVDDAYSRSVRNGTGSYESEHRIVRKRSGEIRVVHERCEHERDASGAIVRSVGMVQDITERKMIEEERQRLNEQLLQSQKLESIGRLAGGVAHDFNNMLGVILGHADLALSLIGPTDPVHGDLVAIEGAARHSADLVKQLLAFARKQPISPKVLDLAETIDGMFTMLRRLIGENVTLAWTPGRKTWPVRIDPAQVSQVLASLCLNARDAIGAFGTVRIETSNVTVGAAHRGAGQNCVPGDYVLLKVTDDGCGMDAEVIEHLFEPFFTTKGVGQGVGLGLSSVYGIVSQNGGFIDVASEPGSGSTFAIYLPRHREQDRPAQGERAKAPDSGGHETVLLVEDEPAILQVGRRMLEARGYTVLTAPTPDAALQLVRQHAGTIDLLITDVIMPGMDGRELAGQITSLHPETRQLFMSGYTADVIASRGVLEEGVNFIEKPFSASALAAKVREALARR